MAVPYGTLLLAATMLLAHTAEEIFKCRKWCSQHLDFTGDALLHGKLWVLFSSSFFHGTHSHLLREVFLMILAGVPLEREIGTLFFVLVFLFSGAVGCTLSWHTLRQSLRRHPEFQEMPPEHVDAIANLSNSRGASACVYGTAFLAILLIGDQNLADNFKISAEYANALLVAARFLPEFLSPLSTRLRKHLFWSLSIFLLLIAMAVSLPARLTVSNSLLFWFFFHCLFRTYPWLLDLGPPREFASTDYMGHIYGAIFSALCGSWHLVNRILQSDLPHLQSWLALIVGNCLIQVSVLNDWGRDAIHITAGLHQRERRLEQLPVLRVVEEVEGHQNYNLRLVAGVKPPSSRAGVKTPPLTEVLEELIQRAGFSVSIFADSARTREPADADILLDMDAEIDYHDASGKHVKLPITSRDITVLQGDWTRCALDAQGRPVLVVVPERFVRLQRECSDDELLELWTLALKAMELKNGPQEGDPFVDMRLNAGTCQNCRHLHLKVRVDGDLFAKTWAAHPAYQILSTHSRWVQTWYG
eukprot:symbB.v1.2.003769.t1/scaffold207.1/size268535/16